VELHAFVDMLRRLGPEDLTAVARAIDASHQTAADEVMAWEDLMRVDEALRLRVGPGSRPVRRNEAVAAVRIAVASSDIEVPETVVTRVRTRGRAPRARDGGRRSRGGRQPPTRVSRSRPLEKNLSSPVRTSAPGPSFSSS